MFLGKRETTRAGFVNSVELLFVLPLIIITFLAIVQFSQYLAAEARLAGASREGARVAASGGDCKQIRGAVLAGLLPGEKKMVQIETNVVDSDGRPDNVLPGSEVVVRVSASTKDILPSPLLTIFVKNSVMVGQTVMRKE